MQRTALSEDEIDILKRYQKTSPIQLIRDKAQALLMRNDGLKIYKIAKYLLKGERTIKRWVSQFNDMRMGFLFSGHQYNENASRLTREQKQEIKTVLSSKPSEYGIPKEFWDVPSLKSYVRAAFGVVYESKQSYYFLLEFSDLRFKYPSPFDVRRDEQLIERRMKEIRIEIKPMLKDDEWEVFASDESRIMLEAITRKAWLKKGEKTVVKVERRRDSQNLIGFLNMKSKKCHVYGLVWQNQDEVIKVMAKFLKRYPNKKVCIIWDNAKFHKGQKIREELKKDNLMGRVHLINLPPYAPDKNPIEHVWGWAKGKISNVQGRILSVVFRRFINMIHGRIFDYHL